MVGLMRSSVPILLLGALLFALAAAGVSALVARPVLTCVAASTAARGEDSRDPDLPADLLLGSYEPDDDDEDDAAAPIPSALSLTVPRLARAGRMPPAWSYVAFLSEPSTPPPRA